MSRKLNIVGLKLRKLRKAHDLSLAELAAKCGVLGWDISGSTISKIEAQQRSTFDCELLILSRALKVELQELYPDKVDNALLVSCLNKPARE